MNLRIEHLIEGKLTQMSSWKKYHQLNRFHLTSLMVLALVLGGLGLDQAEAAEQLALANGITANIYSAQEIESSHLLVSGDRTYLLVNGGSSVELAYGDRTWYPMDQEMVVQALGTMHDLEMPVGVRVFLLPAPPAVGGSSFAREGDIFLAPGFGEVPEVTVAYITTHEMGHVLTWAFIDGIPERWDTYQNLRGLGDESFTSTISHADRAREILAEDIRFLFGGALATYSGTIENHDLLLPDQVPGLKATLVGYFKGRPKIRQVSTSAFPNPCNPLTNIQMVLPEGIAVQGHGAVLQIFDVRGSLVKTLESSRVVDNRVSCQWDGTSDSGGLVASGRYLYIYRLDQYLARGAVTLVR